MIWNFVIIGAVVLIFIILVRRIPLAKEMQKKEAPVSREEMTTYGLMAQADDAFDRKDFPKAEELYIKVASQEPNNAKIYSKLGAIYLEQKNYYDAKDAFLQAVKIEPDNPSRYINLGLAYLGLKDYFKATQTFEEAVKLDPKNKKYQRLSEKAQKARDREKKKI